MIYWSWVEFFTGYLICWFLDSLPDLLFCLLFLGAIFWSLTSFGFQGIREIVEDFWPEHMAFGLGFSLQVILTRLFWKED